MFFSIKRRVDELGRLVLPIDYRNHYEIKGGDTVKISATEGGMLISKESGEGDSFKNVDELGRIVIPSAFRKQYSIEPRSELEVIPCKDGILLLIPKKSIEEAQSTEEGNEMILTNPIMYAFLSECAELAGVTPEEYLLRLEEVLDNNPDELLALLHKQ